MKTRSKKVGTESNAKSVTTITKSNVKTGKNIVHAVASSNKTSSLRQQYSPISGDDVPKEKNKSPKGEHSIIKNRLKTAQHLNETGISENKSPVIRKQSKRIQQTKESSAPIKSPGIRKSSRKVLSLASKKNVVYKNATSLIKTPRKRKSTFEVFDFEYDSTEEPKKKSKKPNRNPRKRPARKKPANDCFKSIHFEVIGNCKKITGTIEKPKFTAPRPVKKIVRNVGRLPIVQIVPDNQVPNVQTRNLEMDVRENSNVVEQNVEENDFHSDNVSLHSPVRSPAVPSPNTDVSPIPYFDFDDTEDNTDKTDTPNVIESSYEIFQPTIYSSAIKKAQDSASSPWRVDTEMRRQRVNLYLNPPLTRANATLSSSPIKSNDGRNLQSSSERLPGSSDDSSPKKQSLISFYREVTMKKRKKHVSKAVADSDAVVPNDSDPIQPQISTDHSSISNSRSAEFSDSDMATARVPLSPLKNNSSTPNKNKSTYPKKAVDYFGFDESEDIENISPEEQFVNCRRRNKNKQIVKRPCLKEWNHRPIIQEAPKVANLITSEPELIMKPVSPTESFNKSDSDTPEEPIADIANETDLGLAVKQLALFEDPVLPEAPSFQEPAKKVYAIRKHNTRKRKVVIIADSDKSDDSDADDYVTKAMNRHKKNKHGANKKEKHELDIWAASFNSMLQEAEDYDLCVE